MYILTDFTLGFEQKTFDSFKALKAYMPFVKANSYKAFREELKKMFGNNIQVNKF